MFNTATFVCLLLYPCCFVLVVAEHVLALSPSCVDLLSPSSSPSSIPAVDVLRDPYDAAEDCGCHGRRRARRLRRERRSREVLPAPGAPTELPPTNQSISFGNMTADVSSDGVTITIASEKVLQVNDVGVGIHTSPSFPLSVKGDVFMTGRLFQNGLQRLYRSYVQRSRSHVYVWLVSPANVNYPNYIGTMSVYKVRSIVDHLLYVMMQWRVVRTGNGQVSFMSVSTMFNAQWSASIETNATLGFRLSLPATIHTGTVHAVFEGVGTVDDIAFSETR